MPDVGFMIGVICFFLALIWILINSIRIVPQATANVIERFGVYKEVWEPGLHMKWPIIEKVARKISLKERILDYPPQPVITRDNVTMQIDTVVYYRVTDPKLYSYGHDNPMLAIEKLTATTMRNIIGELDLDQTLTSREHINDKMRVILDEVSDPWGIKVVRVEVKNILPPTDIQTAMEKQMKAEREKREAILRAEGDKTSNILRAEGEAESNIKRAEGEAEAIAKKAEGLKKHNISIAEGEAESIRLINQAKATALVMLKNADPDEYIVALKGLESLEKIADGKSTKIIIPSDLQSIAGLSSALTSVIRTPEPGTKALPSGNNGSDGKPKE